LSALGLGCSRRARAGFGGDGRCGDWGARSPVLIIAGEVETSLAFPLQPPTVRFFLEAATDRPFFLETEMQTQTFINKADIGSNNWF
jgi:hypothetical protein